MCPGEMVFIHEINNNILISHPFFLGEYQEKYENWELYQEINFGGWEPKLKTE